MAAIMAHAHLASHRPEVTLAVMTSGTYGGCGNSLFWCHRR